MTLIGWCLQENHHLKIIISDDKKQPLKFFDSKIHEQETRKSAIWRGVIERSDPHGTFIKSNHQMLYARNRKYDAIGKTSLWQIQKNPDAHKLPRCQRKIDLENYFFCYRDHAKKISFDARIESTENTELQETLTQWYQKIPHRTGGLNLKIIGQNQPPETLMHYGEALLNEARAIYETTDKDLVKPPPPILAQSLCFPIKQFMAYDNGTALYLKHQLADLPINITKNDETKFMIEVAENIIQEEVFSYQGASMICQTTPACHIIDINSAHHHAPNISAFDINLLLLESLWQVIYLKDFIGVIMVDFIDMNHVGSRKKLHDAMQIQVKNIAQKLDRKPLILHGWTRTGLFEIEYRDE